MTLRLKVIVSTKAPSRPKAPSSAVGFVRASICTASSYGLKAISDHELNCSYTEVKTSTLTPLQDIRAEPSTEYCRVSDTRSNRVAEPIIGSALQDMDTFMTY